MRFHHHGAYAQGDEPTADAPIDLVNVSAADQSWGVVAAAAIRSLPGGDGRSFDLSPVVDI